MLSAEKGGGADGQVFYKYSSTWSHFLKNQDVPNKHFHNKVVANAL